MAAAGRTAKTCGSAVALATCWAGGGQDSSSEHGRGALAALKPSIAAAASSSGVHAEGAKHCEGTDVAQVWSALRDESGAGASRRPTVRRRRAAGTNRVCSGDRGIVVILLTLQATTAGRAARPARRGRAAGSGVVRVRARACMVLYGRVIAGMRCWNNARAGK